MARGASNHYANGTRRGLYLWRYQLASEIGLQRGSPGLANGWPRGRTRQESR